MIPSRVGPYEVKRAIGAGGMGEVYLALDTRLGRQVALKVIRAARARDPVWRRRFEREARAAAALNHPNIFVVHAIDEIDGLLVLVTEYIDGQPLSALIPRTGLPLDKVLQFAVPVASGVAAAHGAGVVHRDLKPSNVMVGADGQVKVLDFGLARWDPGTAESDQSTATLTLTADGALVGTTAYSSPEQAERRRVDHRTDLFSLGNMLYEMATGRRPFAGATEAALVASILRDVPQPPSELAPALPPDFDRIVLRCLEKDVTRRVQSAVDLGSALQDLRERDRHRAGVMLATRAVGTRFVTPMSIAALAVALAVVGGTALWWNGDRGSARPPLVERRVAVASFENRTGEETLGWLEQAAADRVAEGLAETGVVEVVPHARLRIKRLLGSRAPRAGETIGVAKRAGAGLVVVGTFGPVGESIQIQASLFDTSSGHLLVALPAVVGARSALTSALEEIRQRLMTAVHAHLRNEARWYRPDQIPRYQSYREYLAGLESGGDFTSAVAHFSQAVRIEPGFIAAWLRLGLAYRNHESYGDVQTVAQELRRRRQDMTRVARLGADWFVAMSDGRLDDALQDLMDARRLAPDDPWLWQLAARQAIRASRLEVALAIVDARPRRSSPLDSTIPAWTFGVRTDALHLLGRYEEELAVAIEPPVQASDRRAVLRSRIRALAALGRPGEARQLVEDGLTLAASNPTQEYFLRAATEELEVHGHHRDAQANARRALEWFRARPPSERATSQHRLFYGDALVLAGRWNDARLVFADLLREDGGNRDHLGYLAILAALQGRREEARAFVERLERAVEPRQPGARAYWLAEIAAVLGEKERAVSFLRDARAEGWQGFHSDRALSSLRGYPPFEDLVRPRD